MGDERDRQEGPGYHYPGITLVEEGQRLRVTLPDEVERRVLARAARKADWRAARVVPEPERYLATGPGEARGLILVGLWLKLGMIRLGEWYMGQVEADPERPYQPAQPSLVGVEGTLHLGPLPVSFLTLQPVESTRPEKWAGINALIGVGRHVAEEYGLEERMTAKELVNRYGEMFGLNGASAGRELLQFALRYVGDDLFTIPE